MPEQQTLQKARRAKREGKAPSTQAGAFVHEEIEHVREGKHGARSTKQAIAIGLSKARRAGVAVPARGKAAKKTAARTAGKRAAPSKKRARATTKALKREGHAAGSHAALSRQARSAARKRSAASRSSAAKKAARAKGASGRSAAAKKAARTRARKSG